MSISAVASTTLRRKTHGVPQAPPPFVVLVAVSQVVAPSHMTAVVLACHLEPSSDKMGQRSRERIPRYGRQDLYRRSLGLSTLTTMEGIRVVCVKTMPLGVVTSSKPGYPIPFPSVWRTPLAVRPHAGSVRQVSRGVAMNAAMGAQ